MENFENIFTLISVNSSVDCKTSTRLNTVNKIHRSQFRVIFHREIKEMYNATKNSIYYTPNNSLAYHEHTNESDLFPFQKS